MLDLFLGILSSAMISLVMRLSEGHITSRNSMLAVNYLTCLIIAGAYAGFDRLLPEGAGTALGLGVVNGAFCLVSLLLMDYNIRKNGVVLPVIFQKLGLLVPLVVSIVVFREVPTVLQVIGFVVAVASIILINYEKGHAGTGFKLSLLLLLLADGSGSSLSKVFDEVGSADMAGHFLFYTFTVAFVLCAALVLYKKERPGIKELCFGVLIGTPNFFSLRFVLRALRTVPAVIVYPTYGVATIVVVSLVGILLFKERLKQRQWVALAAILAALVMLNV